MDIDKTILKKLNDPPEKPVDTLPVTTSNKILPFEDLAWENFERFCYQLGCKNMNCLNASYIYGRNGQKQDGIDIYFGDQGKHKVWQIKRYEKFKSTDVSNAVNTFLNGKWADMASEFTLCVSNYLDDVAVVDEIVKQSDILKARHITFTVLNSEKLTIKSKEYPELIESFFGHPWIEALGLTYSQSDKAQQKAEWHTNIGIKIDPKKIYRHGNMAIRVDNNNFFVDQDLPDGSNTHVKLNTKDGSVCVQKYPYPLNEYTIDIPESMVLNVEDGKTTINNKMYDVKIYHLKWGKSAILLFDQNGLADIQVDSRTFIDNTNKVIHIIDLAKEAIEI